MSITRILCDECGCLLVLCECDKMIYENDLPDFKSEDELLMDDYMKHRRRRFTKSKFKPDGITDNIEEWEKKAGVHGKSMIKRYVKMIVSGIDKRVFDRVIKLKHYI